MKNLFNGWTAEKRGSETVLKMENGEIVYTLQFKSRWHWRTPDLNGYRIVCNRSKWEDKGSVSVCRGLGKFITVIEDAGNRRTVSKLAALTKELTAAFLEKNFENVAVYTAGGSVLSD